MSCAFVPRRIVPATGLLILWCALAVPAHAQTRPNAKAFAGPDCLSTVVPGLSAPLADVQGGRVPGVHIFATGDELFLHSAGGGLAVDQEYMVYRPDGVVKHPASGDTIGPAINLVARVRVLDVAGDRALARIVAACIEVEPGDLVRAPLTADVSTGAPTPALRPYVLLDPDPDDGTVIHGDSESLANPGGGDPRRGMNVRDAYAIGDVVTIDRGRADGWHVDMPVVVYRTEPLVNVEGTTDDHEAVIVGQGHVVWLLERSAVILLTEGDGTVQVGARARPAAR